MKKDNHIIIHLTDLADVKSAILKRSNMLTSDIFNQAEGFSGKRKRQFLAGRFLLAYLLRRYFDIEHLPAIKIIDNAKPIFIDRQLPNFNISHSEDKIAVAVSKQSAIGLDIEKQRPRKNRGNIIRYCFSKEESRWIEKQQDSLAAFWQLWTLKEAMLKLHGKGVWQMKEVVIDPQSRQVISPLSNDYYYYHKVNSVHLALCCPLPITRLSLGIGENFNKA